MKKFFILFLVFSFFAPSLIFAEGTDQTVATSSDAAIVNATSSEAVNPDLIPQLISAPVITASTTPRAEAEQKLKSSLEKILSPEQIKNFKNVQKIGTALFGVKIKALEKVASSTSPIAPSTNSIASTTNKILEKIAGPWETNLFEKIQKVGNALFGIRKAVKANVGGVQITSDIATCLKTAIDTKDTAINSALTAQSSALLQAVTDRGVCQKAALDLTTNDLIINAFKPCKDAFNTTINTGRDTLKKSRDDAWKTYQQAVKACYPVSTTATSTDVINGNVLLDDGGNNLGM
jgi:hypothetical protein